MKEHAMATMKDVQVIFFKRMPVWALIALLAGLSVIVFHYFSKDRMTVSALVSFSYDGIENGRDPAGNRFDEWDMASEELILEAGDAAELALSVDDAERIRSFLQIRGNVPADIFDSIIDHTSIYGEKEIASAEEVRESSYFPSQYTVTFYYRAAGFPAEEGARFLQELLSAYERYFYNRYGYNASLGQAVASLDYDEYDYINAIDILENRLISLRAYLTSLSSLDNTRFVSEKTGYSFSDLVDAVDTIRDEDVSWITSYIVSNNISKDRQRLIDYYQYRIEDAQRELEQRQSRLYALTTQIDGYEKTRAVLLGVGDGSSAQDGELQGYEFSRKSWMYDALINEKISCETSISDTRERIALYERRREILSSGDSTGSPQVVETALRGIDDKIGRFLSDAHETADEFFHTVWLKRAFQVLSEPEIKSVSVMRLIHDSISDLLIVEAAVFGVFVLAIPASLMRRAGGKSDAGNQRGTDGTVFSDGGTYIPAVSGGEASGAAGQVSSEEAVAK